MTLAVAESCTGGLICHRITSIPGASTFLKMGIVAYSSESKIKVVGIAAGTLETYGAVSVETAREMAEKVRQIAGADFSLSTTGNLGPGALEEKETGLIYIAVNCAGGTFSKELTLQGTRAWNKERAAWEAMEFLAEKAGDVRTHTSHA